MTKPHEETWTAKGAQLEAPEHLVADFAEDFTMEERTESDAARARLAAQAPGMARLLLDLQWWGENDGQTGPFCPVCGGGEPGKRHPDQRETDPVGHEPQCKLATVLRAAGVLP